MENNTFIVLSIGQIRDLLANALAAHKQDRADRVVSIKVNDACMILEGDIHTAGDKASPGLFRVKSARTAYGTKFYSGC